MASIWIIRFGKGLVKSATKGVLKKTTKSPTDFKTVFICETANNNMGSAGDIQDVTSSTGQSAGLCIKSLYNKILKIRQNLINLEGIYLSYLDILWGSSQFSNIKGSSHLIQPAAVMN